MKLASNTTITAPDSLILAGEPGNGKTTLALQFSDPQSPDLFVLDCDQNLAGPMRHLKSEGKVADFYVGSPFFDDAGAPVPRKDQFRRAMALLTDAMNNPAIRKIFIDSSTTFNDLVLTEVLVRQGRRLGTFDFRTSASTAHDEPMQIQDWGMFYNLMKRIIFTLKASNRSIIMSVHIRTDKDQLSGILQKFLAIPGQTGEQIAGWFSEVWLLTRDIAGKKQQYNIQTFPTGRQEAPLGLKSAIGLANTSNPDIKQIKDALSF